MSLASEVKKDLVDRIPLSMILAEYGVETHQGRNVKICCPLHMEDTASFYYDDDLGIYNCFGCHRKGTLVEFVRQYEEIHNGITLSQNEAMKKVAELCDIKIPDLNTKEIRFKPTPKYAVAIDTEKLQTEVSLKRISRYIEKAKLSEDIDSMVYWYSLYDSIKRGGVSQEFIADRISHGIETDKLKDKYDLLLEKVEEEVPY